MKWRNVGIGALAIIGPGVVAALIEYALTRGSSGWIPVLASVTGGILVLVVMLIMQNRRQEAMQEHQVEMFPSERREAVVRRVLVSQSAVANVEQPRRPSETKNFSPRTPEELVSEIEGRTELVAEEISKRHIGNWLRVEWTIGSMPESLYIGGHRRVSVGLDRGDDLVSVHLAFDASKWRDRLMSFDKGDFISVEGQIYGIAPLGYVSLENCELLE